MTKIKNKDYIDFTIRVPIELKEYLDSIVESYSMPRAAIVRKMIEQVQQDGFRVVKK